MKTGRSGQGYLKRLQAKYGINEARLYQSLDSDMRHGYTRYATKELLYPPSEYLWWLEYRNNFIPVKHLYAIFGIYFVDKTLAKFEKLLREEISEEMATYYLNMVGQHESS